jgi:hypothetical protein
MIKSIKDWVRWLFFRLDDNTSLGTNSIPHSDRRFTADLVLAVCSKLFVLIPLSLFFIYIPLQVYLVVVLALTVFIGNTIFGHMPNGVIETLISCVLAHLIGFVMIAGFVKSHA